MEHNDPRRLVRTARTKSYFSRVSDDDEMIKGVVGYGAVISAASSFGIAVLISYLGTDLELNDVAKPIVIAVLFAAIILIATIPIDSAPGVLRGLLQGVSIITAIGVGAAVVFGGGGKWPLYVAPFVYLVTCAVVATRKPHRESPQDSP